MSKLTSPFGSGPTPASRAVRKYFPAARLLSVMEYGGGDVRLSVMLPWRSRVNTMFVAPAGLDGVAVTARFVAVTLGARRITLESTMPAREIPCPHAKFGFAARQPATTVSRTNRRPKENKFKNI